MFDPANHAGPQKVKSAEPWIYNVLFWRPRFDGHRHKGKLSPSFAARLRPEDSAGPALWWWDVPGAVELPDPQLPRRLALRTGAATDHYSMSWGSISTVSSTPPGSRTVGSTARSTWCRNAELDDCSWKWKR